MSLADKCYRNRCFRYNLYWAADVPPPGCEVNYEVLEIDWESEVVPDPDPDTA